MSVTNSLIEIHPQIAAEWHPTKNGALTPDRVIAGSHQKVWWKCTEGPDHEWAAIVVSRTSKGSGCPACRGLQVSITNSLASLYPEVAAYWHPTKNGELTADRVSAGSDKKVWWKCPNGGPDHDWSASVYNRTHGTGCPRCNVGWTVSSVRAFVASLLPHLADLTPAETYVVFQQSGILGPRRAPTSNGFVNALATGRFPHDDAAKFVAGEPSLVDNFLSDSAFTMANVDTAPGVESLGETQPQLSMETDTKENELPVINTRGALAVLDHHVIASADEEAIAFLVASAKAKLWTHAYRDESGAIAQAEAHEGGEYATRVRDLFLGEHAAARALHIPPGYSFKLNGKLMPPNLMQRLVAVRVRDQRRYGNWSGTGAGKTLSAILSTRVTKAKLTVICCPNAVVEHWSREVERIFPDSIVRSKTWTPTWSGKAPRYLVQNYEQFQQPDSEAKLKVFLDRESVDFVVVDEIHYAKQRHVENVSHRKRLVMALVATAGERKPDLCVLGMSATPVINNLQEGKSLVELVTGVAHDDLDTKATVPNCMQLYQRLVTLGTRWLPDYAPQLDEHTIDVDISQYVDEIRALGRDHGPLDLERILTQARLPTILEQLRPGRKTLVYTHYVEGIDKMLADSVATAGLKVGLYTGDDKTGLDGFLNGDVDVLIGSSSIGTGVDGLQHVCEQLVINVLPWTHAEYVQLVGRIYRQGQRADRVRVVIPTTFATVKGQRWSYCDSKLARIRYKKSIADAAVDGVVPEGHLRSSPQAHADLMAWLERLGRGETAEVVRRRITVPLDEGDAASVRKRQSKYGDFSKMNARWNTTGSARLQERLAEDPEEWAHYHTLYRQARAAWPILPYKEFVAWAQHREGYVIGDFGCGEALVADALGDRHVVHSFDHVAINDKVIGGDMAHTSLDDACLDVAVFSLSLMGANFTEYLREAHRALKLDGLLQIWEARSRFDDPVAFCRELEKLGFRCHLPDERGQFLFIEARKTERTPDSTVRLSFRHAEP